MSRFQPEPHPRPHWLRSRVDRHRLGVQAQLLRRERLQRPSTHYRLFQDALTHQTVVVLGIALIAPDGRLLSGQDETTAIRTCIRVTRAAFGGPETIDDATMYGWNRGRLG